MQCSISMPSRAHVGSSSRQFVPGSVESDEVFWREERLMCGGDCGGRARAWARRGRRRVMRKGRRGENIVAVVDG